MDESNKKGVKGVKRAVLYLVISSVLAICSITGAFWLRAETLGDTKDQVCHAIKINNDILHDLIVHVERRSIESIEEGATGQGPGDITPEQVIRFYQPTLERLSKGECPK